MFVVVKNIKLCSVNSLYDSFRVIGCDVNSRSRDLSLAKVRLHSYFSK